MTGHNVTMLGTGLIGLFYTMTLHGGRGRDRVRVVYSRTEERARAFAEEWSVPVWTTELDTEDGLPMLGREKAETTSGWLFPVGDEMAELGYVDMFNDMFDSMDKDRPPMETLYDGYVVNAIMDACYRSAASKRWEPVELEVWRGAGVEPIARARREHDGKVVIKEEKMPDGRRKLILKDESSGEISDVVANA